MKRSPIVQLLGFKTLYNYTCMLTDIAFVNIKLDYSYKRIMCLWNFLQICFRLKVFILLKLIQRFKNTKRNFPIPISDFDIFQSMDNHRSNIHAYGGNPQRSCWYKIDEIPNEIVTSIRPHPLGTNDIQSPSYLEMPLISDYFLFLGLEPVTFGNVSNSRTE